MPAPRLPVTVQPLTPRAWRLYRALRLAALQDAPDAFGSTLAAEAQRPPAQWRERLAAAQASGLDLPLLARAGRRAAGLLWAKADAAQPRSVHLYQMWVAPGLRGRGVGQALLDEAIAWAGSVQARQVELGVTLGDTPALRLYRAAGFQAFGPDTPLREGSPLRAQAMRLLLPAGRACVAGQRVATAVRQGNGRAMERGTEMHVRSVARSDVGAVHRLLVASGWAHRVGSVEDFGRLLAASQRALVAVQDAHIVGFARAITDGMSNGYVSMVVVDPAFRRQGIGQALVQALIGEDEGITWVLRAGREGAAAFFAKLGFCASTVAMERTRR